MHSFYCMTIWACGLLLLCVPAATPFQLAINAVLQPRAGTHMHQQSQRHVSSVRTLRRGACSLGVTMVDDGMEEERYALHARAFVCWATSRDQRLCHLIVGIVDVSLILTPALPRTNSQTFGYHHGQSQQEGHGNAARRCCFD